ncbi:SUF system Fe-S cluster assembly protein [Arenicella xantha]|uniref:FeS assembly SUF system protein n=1 Tax=Arenicella xantha TaxID=644221 RepID=A0A395JQJ5_9GAMM|nr:SUF system Fe-S cluster assembly protein [Arenicella xantha]RBP53633.1 FeS assembly SUF system protein [Arenicella xantha]
MNDTLTPYIVLPEGKTEADAAKRSAEPRTPEELGPDIIEALRTVYDPEIPVNIYDLGLIYNFEVDEDFFVDVSMTLTAPGCPVAETFPGIVENAVKSVVGVSDARVELTFDPPWTMANMSEEAKLELGMI